MKYTYLLLGLLATACRKQPDEVPTPLNPVARFSAPAAVNANAPLQVTNQSANATGYLWTWGDGTTSTTEAPAHLFDWYGKVRVRLAVTSPVGTDTTSQIVQVNAGGPPASVMSSAVGRYGGRLYLMTYATNGSYTTRVRDTTLQITAVDDRRVRMMNNDFDYLIGSLRAPRTWLGHAPQRGNILFTNFRHTLQLEVPGDSVYLSLYSGGVATASAIWKFYGKKQP